MDDLIDGIEFLVKFCAFLFDVVVGFLQLLGWIWSGMLGLLGPVGALLGLGNLMVLPWWHTPTTLAASALLWLICLLHWQVLRSARQ